MIYKILLDGGRLFLDQIAWPLFIVCAVLGVALLLKEVSRVQKERLMMTKLRNSHFYARLYPTVRAARRQTLDQVRVERSSVKFISLIPTGRLSEYAFANDSFRILSGHRTRALAEVLGEDIPVLNSHRYSLHRYLIVRPNGSKEYGYVYTLRALYKAQVLAGQNALYQDRTTLE